MVVGLTRWRKSSACQTGECAEVTAWRKATASNFNGSCVEAGQGDAAISVRDSKHRGAGPVLTFTPAAWRKFISSLKA